MRGNNPAQNSRRNINHWMGASPLDAGNITSPGAINSASVAIMRRVKPHSHTCESRNQLVLSPKNQNSTFSPQMRGKNQSFEGLL